MYEFYNYLYVELQRCSQLNYKLCCLQLLVSKDCKRTITLVSRKEFVCGSQHGFDS